MSARCQTCQESRIDCVAPYQCAMNWPLHRVVQDYNMAADTANFVDGGETVDLEHTPRGMPITFVGDEPAEPVAPAEPDLWTGRWLYIALGMAILATVLLSAYRG